MAFGKASSKGAHTGSSPYQFKRCDNCGGQGHIAKDCSSPQVCNACGSPDHKKVDCPAKDKRCDICFKVGHLKARCNMAVKGGGKGAAASFTTGKTCDICGQVGHLKASCPRAGGKGGKKGYGKADHSSKTCDLCGQVGHIKANCPTDECWDFAKTGSCPRGDRCGFSHGGVLPSPKPAFSAGAGGKKCHVCGQVGHLAAQCPNR